MFQIKIHPISISSDILKSEKKSRAYKMRSEICNEYQEALLSHISDCFDVGNIDETLFLKFYATNDKIKKDFSFIKDKKFKSSLQKFIEDLHSPIGLIF